MDKLVFPERACIRIEIEDPAGRRPLELSGMVFSIRLTARQKSDYFLSPFVSDSSGLLWITREACEFLVQSEHDSGLMDYAGLEFCRSEVEIRHLNGEEIQKAAHSRRTVWRQLLRGEDRLFASIEDLVAVYERAPNANLGKAQALRVRWDGTNPHPEYLYVVASAKPT